MPSLLKALLRARGSVILVPGDTLQVFLVAVRVAPGVGLEPPAADGRQQGSQMAVLAGLLERGVKVGVVALQDRGAGVGGQDGPDGGRGAGRAGGT